MRITVSLNYTLSLRKLIFIARQKMRIFSALGIDYYCLLRFSKEVAETSAADFIE